LSRVRIAEWQRTVVARFAYLQQEFGYRPAEIDEHFRGSTIRFEGAVYVVVHALDLDAGWLDCQIWSRQPGTTLAVSASTLINRRSPRPIPARSGSADLERASVERMVAEWADGLYELAADILAGAPLDRDLLTPLWSAEA
jgi:hypothetical protein